MDSADRRKEREKKIKINEFNEYHATLWGLCFLHDDVFSSWRSVAGWEKQEEDVPSLPASEAGRRGGSNSALSGIAPWG